MTIRVLVASDAFGPLPATEAAALVEQAWRAAAAHVDVQVCAQGGGRRGTAAALAASVGAEPTVLDVAGATVPAYVLGRERAFLDAGESGEAVGAAAARLLADGCDQVVLALGDAPQIDGGRGFLRGFTGADDPAALDARRLVALPDTDRVLLGFQGAAYSAVEERGLGRQEAQDVERSLGDWVERVRAAHPDKRDLLSGTTLRAERQPGAGAGGGLGYLLAAAGAQLVSAPTYSAAATGLAEHVAAADLVVTTTTVFDWRVLDHSVLRTTTDLAAAAATAIVVIADEVHVGRREQMSLGVQGAYAVHRPGRFRDQGATVGVARADLAGLVRRVANTWTPAARGDVR